MARLTAEEARHLAGPTLNEKIDCLLESIRSLAMNRRRSCRTSYDHKQHNDLWVDCGYSDNKTKDWSEAKKILQGLGYKVSFYYSEGSMAVDMYTLIEW